jgi:hypothetical protein
LFSILGVATVFLSKLEVFFISGNLFDQNGLYNVGLSLSSFPSLRRFEAAGVCGAFYDWLANGVIETGFDGALKNIEFVDFSDNQIDRARFNEFKGVFGLMKGLKSLVLDGNELKFAEAKAIIDVQSGEIGRGLVTIHKEGKEDEEPEEE